MRVLILGAGHTGYAVAQALVCESNDISVVDVDASRVSQLQRHFDLRGIVGDAASPAVLREAGIEDTDILIAVTASDETNLVASLLAAKAFNVPTRIARVRRNELSNYPALLGAEGFHITDTIWPEQALTDTLLRLIEFPEAHQVIDLASGVLTLLALTVKETSPLIGLDATELAEKLTHANIVSVALFRDGALLEANAPLAAGDEMLAIVPKDGVLEAISLIHPKEAKTKNLVIAGDAHLALRVVTALKNQASFNIKILENDKETATDIARHLPERVLLVNGSNLQEEDLANVDIDTCDLFVSLSGKDDANIMSALLAKRLGAKRVIALVDNQTFADLVRDTNIDVIISKTQVTLSELMQYVRRGDIAAVHELHHGKAELIEVIAHGSAGISRVIGKTLREISLPDKVRLCGLIRDKAFLTPSETLTIEPDDRLIVFLADKSSYLKLRLFLLSMLVSSEASNVCQAALPTLSRPQYRGDCPLLFTGFVALGLIASILFDDGAQSGFLFALSSSFACAVAFIALTRHDKRDLLPRDGFLLATLLWAILPVFASLPLSYLPEISFSQAYFEAMSGITTTCATVFSVDHLPESINLWRALLSWLGGMGILILAIALLPLMSVGGSQLFRFVNLCQAIPSISPLFGIGTNKSSVTSTEVGATVEVTKLTPRIASTAKGLWWIYFALTLSCLVGYKVAGMTWFDATIHAFSTVSLGGFSSHDASFAFWANPAIDLVCVVFMLLSGLSFTLHFLVWRRKNFLLYFQDPESRAWFSILLIGVLVVTGILIFHENYDSTKDAFLYALFNVVSVASTTGFSSTDYSHWPVTATTLMLCLAAFCPCSGSVGGGIKMMRALILLKQLSRGFLQTLHPKAVVPLRINRVPIPDNIVFMVLNFVLLWAATLIGASLCMIATGLDAASAFTAVFACLTNTGPGLANVGPALNYGTLSVSQLWLCDVCMLVGRLEIVTVFVLFTRDFWRV